VLSLQLQGTYHHDRTLLNRKLLLPQQPTVLLRPDQLRPAPVSLAQIRRRGVLRVGLQQDSPPWAYRNSQGQIVGYDIDMLQALARTLEVNLALVPVPLPQLDTLLREQKIDLAAGGIQNTPSRASESAVSGEYQQVHLALLVPDERLDLIKNLAAHPLRRSLRLGVRDPSLIGVNLRDQLAALLGPPGRPIPLRLREITDPSPFSGPNGAQVDAMLVTAEGGSALALLDPSTSMLTVFGSSLPEQLVLLIGGTDHVLRDYIDTWLARKADQGFLQRLYQHWVLLQDGTAWKPSPPVVPSP
jgi:proton glutamate symport protein